MQASVTLKNLDQFLAGMTKASEEVQKKMNQEMTDSAIVIASQTKVLINKTPGAGGKMGRIVTGRYINSFHHENKAIRAYSYSDRLGQSFSGTFKSERPDVDTVLVGSNVVYAPVLEGMDGTFARAWDTEVKELGKRWRRILGR